MSHHDPTLPPLVTLVASIVVLAAAPLLHRAARWSPIAMRSLGLGVAAATVLLVVVEILPECAHEIGISAYAIAIVGLFGSIAFERRVSTAAHRLAPWLVALALGIHAITDGLAIAGDGHEHGHALGLAVVMHRLPVGLALWFLLRPRGRAVAVAALAIEGGGTIVGYALGGSIAPLVDAAAAWAFQAFVAGVLLHVVMHVRGGR
jgi:zinc transporter ZupT